MTIKNQKGIATILGLIAIVGAFGVGIYFERFSHEIDSPAEQAAEEVLDDFGIDVDFSKDKKEKEADETRRHPSD